jgi:uncharacterized membrane protein YeaQ/YmgE (transglycosylase-associated protein family)
VDSLDLGVHFGRRLERTAGRRIRMGFLAWIVVGGIAGWIFGLLGIWPGGGMIGSIIVAFVGAVILIWITRLVKKA